MVCLDRITFNEISTVLEAYRFELLFCPKIDASDTTLAHL
jgi:hypothetical protein